MRSTFLKLKKYIKIRITTFNATRVHYVKHPFFEPGTLDFSFETLFTHINSYIT